MGVCSGWACPTSSMATSTRSQSRSPSVRARTMASRRMSRSSGGSYTSPSCAMTTCSGKYQAQAGPAEASVAAPAQSATSRVGETLLDAEKLLPGDRVRSMISPTLTFQQRTVDELDVEDERSFRHVGLYADLKEVLRRARYPFQILPRTRRARA